jgi:hypothetical protein
MGATDLPIPNQLSLALALLISALLPLKQPHPEPSPGLRAIQRDKTNRLDRRRWEREEQFRLDPASSMKP